MWLTINSENLPGLCLYCASGSPNSTDTCCYNSNAQKRCDDVDLPTATSLPPIFTVTASPSTTGSAGTVGSNDQSRLSGGAIAGITVGALAGVALVALLVLFCRRRRRRYRQPTSTFNQPPRIQRSPSMTFNPVASSSVHAQGYEALAGSRIARMSALESANNTSDGATSSPPVAAERGRRVINTSSSSDFGLEDSPESNPQRRYSPQNRPLHPPPRDRNASLSSASVLMTDNPTSPVTDSDRGLSSPQYASPQSEQLPYFKVFFCSQSGRSATCANVV
jgi:hypothetical protein